jgi:hypothetical protein
MKLLFFLLMSFQCSANNIHHIFLSAQAETKHREVNPSLSQCGRLRAQQLSTLLSYTELKRIYSTTDLSAMETANPISKTNGIPIKIFTPKLLDSLAVTVIKEHKNALVVADNDTIEYLVEFISNRKLQIPSYHRQNILYQIVLLNDQVFLTILKQPLEC